jgi:hypothetical protein
LLGPAQRREVLEQLVIAEHGQAFGPREPAECFFYVSRVRKLGPRRKQRNVRLAARRLRARNDAREVPLSCLIVFEQPLDRRVLYFPLEPQLELLAPRQDAR